MSTFDAKETRDSSDDDEEEELYLASAKHKDAKRTPGTTPVYNDSDNDDDEEKPPPKKPNTRPSEEDEAIIDEEDEDEEEDEEDVEEYEDEDDDEEDEDEGESQNSVGMLNVKNTMSGKEEREEEDNEMPIVDPDINYEGERETSQLHDAKRVYMHVCGLSNALKAYDLSREARTSDPLERSATKASDARTLNKSRPELLRELTDFLSERLGTEQFVRWLVELLDDYTHQRENKKTFTEKDIMRMPPAVRSITNRHVSLDVAVANILRKRQVEAKEITQTKADYLITQDVETITEYICGVEHTHVLENHLCRSISEYYRRNPAKFDLDVFTYLVPPDIVGLILAIATEDQDITKTQLRMGKINKVSKGMKEELAKFHTNRHIPGTVIPKSNSVDMAKLYAWSIVGSFERNDIYAGFSLLRKNREDITKKQDLARYHSAMQVRRYDVNNTAPAKDDVLKLMGFGAKQFPILDMIARTLFEVTLIEELDLHVHKLLASNNNNNNNNNNNKTFVIKLIPAEDVIAAAKSKDPNHKTSAILHRAYGMFMYSPKPMNESTQDAMWRDHYMRYYNKSSDYFTRTHLISTPEQEMEEYENANWDESKIENANLRMSSRSYVVTASDLVKLLAMLHATEHIDLLTRTSSYFAFHPVQGGAAFTAKFPVNDVGSYPGIGEDDDMELGQFSMTSREHKDNWPKSIGWSLVTALTRSYLTDRKGELVPKNETARKVKLFNKTQAGFQTLIYDGPILSFMDHFYSLYSRGLFGPRQRESAVDPHVRGEFRFIINRVIQKNA
jgi:hypothetical protein